jgi:methylenetetrahydrofolate dehydrogenase (NADP+)/methenyltetrahydrofolate cyclohydrolase
MTAVLISGLEVSASIRGELKARTATLAARGIVPRLEVILVGDDPASISYIKSKEKGSAEVGIRENTTHLPADTSEKKIIELLDRLNADPAVDGILVQVPLPAHIDTEKVLYHISPEKDVDGFHPVNLGKLMRGEPCFLPCTPHGIQQMLVRCGYDPAGKHVVISAAATWSASRWRQYYCRRRRAPTRRSQSCIPALSIYPASPGRPIYWWPPWAGPGILRLTWSGMAPWS